jgi:hypothetical protein
MCGLLSAGVGVALLAVSGRVAGLVWLATPIATLGLVLVGMWLWSRSSAGETAVRSFGDDCYCPREYRMTLALAVKLLKTSQGSFGPKVAAAAEAVMRYLDGILDQELESRIATGRPVFKLPRGYYFDVTGRGYYQLCLPERVHSEEQAQRVFANDVAVGLLEEICAALDSERARLIRDELGLEA